LFRLGINHKIIFGTDWPLNRMSGGLAGLVKTVVDGGESFAGVRRAERELVLSGNLLRVLPPGGRPETGSEPCTRAVPRGASLTRTRTSRTRTSTPAASTGEVWRRARAAHPVAWTESPAVGGFWSVTTHREGAQVLKTKAFASASGMRLGGNPAGVAAAAGRMLVVTDGDRHRGLRAAHAAWFTGGALSGLLPDLARRVDERIRVLLDEGAGFDAVSELAVQLPAWALFRLMGVPARTGTGWPGWPRPAFDDTGADAAAASARTRAHAEILGYFVELVDRRRVEPGRRPGHRPGPGRRRRPAADRRRGRAQLRRPDQRGLETTRTAASGALLAFHRHPEQWRLLKSDRRCSTARSRRCCDGPRRRRTRCARRRPTWRSAPRGIRAGDRVVVWLPSCNRDERVFAEPDRFLIGRSPTRT